MPTYMQGDMRTVINQVDHFIVTTNSFIKTNGAVVMGRGLAKQVRDSFPGVDKALGQEIVRVTGLKQGGKYGLLLGNPLSAFQVKYHFKDTADIELIEFSTDMLHREALVNPNKKYALNFPGIGNGKLSYDEVKPIIDELPDNVQVWTFK